MDLMGGHIDTVIDNVGVQKPLIEAGKVHPILTTAPTRLETLPNIPTAQELGLLMSAVAWFGLAAPKGTPSEIIQRVQSAVSATFAQAEVRQKLLNDGFVPLASTPAFAEERVRRDAAQLGKAAKDFNLRLQ
jgi:tripartite-type tricarboxylate transporter receptor subunit TctC